MKKTFFIMVMAIAAVACNNTATKNNAEKDAGENRTEVSSRQEDLFGKGWKLLELNGKAVVSDATFPKYPHLIFEKENRISGNLGCNGFGGNIVFEANNTIKISGISATQMACPNLEIEQGFLDALNHAEGFALENNILTLSNSKKEVTAKLEAAAK